MGNRGDVGNQVHLHACAFESPQGGIIDKDMPIPVANVTLLCDDCGPTRVGYRFDSDGTKVRVCKKCRKDLD